MKRSIIYKILMLSLLIYSIANGQTVFTLVDTLFASGDISVDSQGDIFVADYGNTLPSANGTNVYKVFRDGSYSVFATGLQGASGNDFDSQGNLLQSNIAAHKVSKITPQGVVSDFATSNILFPVGLVIGPGDTAYVTNCISPPARITKIAPDGTTSIFVSDTLLNCPNGLTMDEAGNLYTCNFSDGRVVKITPAGVASELANIPGNNNGHLTFANGKLYVVARCANQIYEVTQEGQVSLLAGSGARGNDDGPALEATFSLPNGIATSPNGDTLYVNDDLNFTGGCFNALLNPIAVRMIVLSPLGIENPAHSSTPRFELQQNYPNPFNPETTIRYVLWQTSRVTLKIFDVMGREVRTLVDDTQVAGRKSVIWDGKNELGRPVASGVYVYQLQTGFFVQSRKMLLVK